MIHHKRQMFVFAWELSTTPSQAACKLREYGFRMTTKRCEVYAEAMRRRGVDLKFMGRPVYTRFASALSN